jgi:hypothetical protein
VTIPDRSSTSTLESVVAELLEGLPELATAPGGAGRSWTREDVEFAVVGPLGVELRLDAQVALAAARTPDAAPSPRGPEWVRFNPRELDGHALDRLRAWVDLAYRRAGE